jgi:hypothetical protein
LDDERFWIARIRACDPRLLLVVHGDSMANARDRRPLAHRSDTAGCLLAVHWTTCLQAFGGCGEPEAMSLAPRGGFASDE